MAGSMALDVVKLRALQAPDHPEIALTPEMSLSSMEQKKDRRAVDSAIAGKHPHLENVCHHLRARS